MDVKGASDYYPVFEEDGKQLKRLSNTTGGPVGSSDAVANANTNHLRGWPHYPVVEDVKGASDYYPVVEEDGKQLKRLSNTTGGLVGSGDAVANANTNRLPGWHHSSRIIRVSRASSGKDRHSKVWTSKGLRDRRVRLSVHTAIQFYDLQDRLGYDKPSKAVEWLIRAAADPISELPSLRSPFPDTPNQLRDEKHASKQIFDSADVELDGDPNFQQNQSQHLSMSKSSWNSASENSKSSGLTLSRSEIRENSESGLSLSRSEIRVKARERARERAAKEKEKEMEFWIAQNVNYISNNSLEEKGEKQIASEPHDDSVIDVEPFKMADLSEQMKFEIEEIGNLASQTRQPEGIQAGEMQPGALSTQEVVFDVGAVKILKSSGQMESQNKDIEIEPEASEQCGLFLMQGGLGLTKPQKNEDWENSKEIYLMDSELSVLPENPRCPNLSALFLPRNYKLRTIPPTFFDYMPALQILNLSRTGIKSLPDSLIRLVSLKRLFLNDCHRLMTLSPKVGNLKLLEVLDLEGAKIMDLPEEIKKLTNLTCLEVSFYGYTSNGRRAMQTNAAVPCGVISALSQLEELNVDVNSDDERWDACVEDIVNEICTLKRLDTLKFYFPKVELLSHFHWNSLKLSHFRFNVGRHVKRIMSRVPRDVEFELERWERCLKYINGVGVPRDIKNVLQHVTAFFLDRHVTVKKLSDFGTGNMRQLKCCVVGECNEIQVIIDAEDAYGEEVIGEIVSESYDAERIVLGSLEYLYIYYMKSLRSIWVGSVQQNSLFLLKFLTLRTCPMLTTIFTQGLLDNLCNLEELKVEDCPSIKSIVSCGNFAELRTSHFLPNLKKILLHYMPGLVSISSGLHIAPQLEFLSLYNCPNLKNPLVDEVSCQDLKKIKGERSWWEALEWSNGRPCYLDEIFVPTDI